MTKIYNKIFTQNSNMNYSSHLINNNKLIVTVFNTK
jgi:hypothetical protein